MKAFVRLRLILHSISLPGFADGGHQTELNQTVNRANNLLQKSRGRLFQKIGATLFGLRRVDDFKTWAEW